MELFRKNWMLFLLRELRDIIILVLISTFITFFFAGDRLFSNFNVYINSIFYGFIVGWTIWKGNQGLSWFLDRLVPWEVKPVFALAVHLSSSIIFTLIDIFIVNYLVYRYVFNVNLFDDFTRFFGFASIQFGIALLITTIFYVKHYFDSWRILVVRAEKFKSEALALQYETLKSYVNPHFLFNSLSVLSSLVEKDTAKSQEFIKQLSDIYRYVLEQKDKELVKLETELSFVESFINLHRIRHGESLKITINIDDKSGHVIPLSIQILLENAFKHNIISEEEPLEVIIWRENDYIIVQNKLQTRKTISQSGGIGLETIQKRYAFFTNRPMEINSENGFYTVKVPVLNLSTLEGFK
ncbi:MAG: sensor histidine kinase [Tenuifilaceae bacterium]